MLSRYAPLALLPGFVLCGMLVHFSNANLEEVHASFRTDEIEAAKESIALSLMGQLQFTAQSLVWMKTLEYLHNGVAFRMPTNAEEERGFRAKNSVGTAGGLEHAEGVPLALNKELDWRGPVGELHRVILPHMTDHRHSDPLELIPWYQLTLRLNPNIERLYTLGAFFMADFAKEPEAALHLLETGVQANPWTFEVRSALGRLLFDYHQQLGLRHTEACERAVTILREAVARAKDEKQRIENNRDHFDDYQKQMFRDSYLFLAKSLTVLKHYEDAIAVCEEGYEVTGHNYLNVQKRIITRRINGEEAPEDADSSAPNATGSMRTGTNDDNTRAERRRQDDSPSEQRPVSITLGIVPPEKHASGEERPILRTLLSDIHDYPYESITLRANRLNINSETLLHAAQELCELRFAAPEDPGANIPASFNDRHHLTPIGLYVHTRHYGFDFWNQMAMEAENLHRRGVAVDLFADAMRVSEKMK